MSMWFVFFPYNMFKFGGLNLNYLFKKKLNSKRYKFHKIFGQKDINLLENRPLLWNDRKFREKLELYNQIPAPDI